MVSVVSFLKNIVIPYDLCFLLYMTSLQPYMRMHMTDLLSVLTVYSRFLFIMHFNTVHSLFLQFKPLMSSCILQYTVGTCVYVATFTAGKGMVTAEKETQSCTRTCGLCSNMKFQPLEPLSTGSTAVVQCKTYQ